MRHLIARQYLGVPFRHQGRNPALGIDCIGLLILVCGGSEHDTTYGREPHDGLLETHLRMAFGNPVSGMRPGDVAAIRWAGPVRHVGIVGEIDGALSLIHTSSGVGRVVEHRLDAKWRKRIAGVYRP